MNADALLAELAKCRAAGAMPGQPAPLHRAVDEAVQRLVGHKLFTLLVVDGQEVARVYSSNPKDYPVSGRKPMNRTPWGDHVMKGRKTWIARSAVAVVNRSSTYSTGSPVAAVTEAPSARAASAEAPSLPDSEIGRPTTIRSGLCSSTSALIASTAPSASSTHRGDATNRSGSLMATPTRRVP